MADLNERARELCAANPLIPVVVIDDPDDAVAAGKALLEGGIACAELTFRTERAADVLREMTKVEGLAVGAGTVINVAQAKAALEAGAQFLVSPGLSASVAHFAAENNVVYIPGVSSATEIMAALDHGIEILKFFPAVASGGLPTVKALSAPFPQVRFVATGGIGPKNLTDWLQAPAIASVGGSWMITRDDVANQRFDAIAEASGKAAELVKEIKR